MSKKQKSPPSALGDSKGGVEQTWQGRFYSGFGLGEVTGSSPGDTHP